MAYQPNDPYRASMPDDVRRQARLDNELHADPVLEDDRQSNGAKVAMFAVAIAVVLGALFYGLNNSRVNEAGTEPGSRTAQTQPANPPSTSGIRDVTPRANTAPGTTTGAAPSANPPSAPAAPRIDNPNAK